MNNVAWTASHPPGDKLKWKAFVWSPTEYADYVTFVFGFVHVWCCHKFVCLCDGKEGDSDGKEGRVMGRRGQ